MLNEQQITRLLYRLQDPVLEASLEETEGVLEVQVLKETANIKIALADPAVETDHFVHNIEELLTQFGVNEINIELEYLPAAVIDRIFQARDNILSEASETKFLAIASGKGGVGKSTVSANLAIALAQQGKKVGLLDADIYGFSIPVLLGTTESPPQRKWPNHPSRNTRHSNDFYGFFCGTRRTSYLARTNAREND